MTVERTGIDLIDAAVAGDIPALRALLETSGLDLNIRDARGRTALMAATYADQPAAVDLLLQAGADLDLQDDMQNNPFLYAGAEGLMEILKLTHRAGADPTMTNRYGGVAIIPASEKGHLDAVRYLLEETDVDVNHVNNLGWTALLEAVILTDGGPVFQQIVAELIAHGADVNIADGDGVTPLQHARQRGYREIEAQLVNAGAS
ncbi:MAG: ankyrin repeat domain-containing protein [Thermomicrobiales bacterium]|nr:ankyrin repeat domain-containing protein [Thermomicrobiales bacterium]MCO5223147.1 ankyrin repeat domain-containing protein [Thermomicrobiales bacterium]